MGRAGVRRILHPFVTGYDQRMSVNKLIVLDLSLDEVDATTFSIRKN